MQVSSKGVASTLVFASLLEDEQRLSVGVLLTALKSEIKPAKAKCGGVVDGP